MSKVKDMLMDIQEELVDAIESGETPEFEKIAKDLGVPVQWVKDEYDVMQNEMFGGNMEPSEYDEWQDFDPAC